MITPKTSLLFVLMLFIYYSLAAPFNVTTISFNQGYSTLWGDTNLIPSSDGKSVSLLLDHSTGSGFVSLNPYQYGFFSAKIKLPSGYSAGVVIAFYVSNADVFQKTHDELDFEFLGNILGKEWNLQTNTYGNGSVNRGREERYNLWFDPTREYHEYSILWTSKTTIFYIDEVPIREVLRNKDMQGDYPSKPMSIYATIWDGSKWATNGGKHKTNYKYAPYVSQFSDFVLQGCAIVNSSSATNISGNEAELENAGYGGLTMEQQMAMRLFRQRYMYYSYCYDTIRYHTPPPECLIIPKEKQQFSESGRLKFHRAPAHPLKHHYKIRFGSSS